MADIPQDFPRQPPLAALAGAQPKISVVRTREGRYVQGPTEPELQARYEMCADLVDQLVRYCDKKRAERPEWTVDYLLRKVGESVRAKGWDLSTDELDWVLGRLRDRMTGQP